MSLNSKISELFLQELIHKTVAISPFYKFSNYTKHNYLVDIPSMWVFLAVKPHYLAALMEAM